MESVTHRSSCRHGLGGFTLIELMAVVVVIAILAAIALPAYTEYVRRSRRAEAITLLNSIAQQQERWRANNQAYTADLSASGVNVANPSSGYYTLQAASATATGYRATATAAGAQSADTKCSSLTLRVDVGNVFYEHTGSATANQCWNR